MLYYPMEDKILARWLSVYALKFLETHTASEINEDKIFNFIDNANSSILNMLLRKYKYTLIAIRLSETINDFK